MYDAVLKADTGRDTMKMRDRYWYRQGNVCELQGMLSHARVEIVESLELDMRVWTGIPHRGCF